MVTQYTPALHCYGEHNTDIFSLSHMLSLLCRSSERKQAVKISIRGDEPGFFKRWNPFSIDIPFTIFESHILERKGEVTGDTRLQVQNFVETLGEVIQAAGQDVNVTEGPVQIYSYFNVWGAVYNQSRMGFHKTRGFGSWEMR